MEADTSTQQVQWTSADEQDDIHRIGPEQVCVIRSDFRTPPGPGGRYQHTRFRVIGGLKSK
jgi:hypothetical protein